MKSRFKLTPEKLVMEFARFPEGDVQNLGNYATVEFDKSVLKTIRGMAKESGMPNADHLFEGLYGAIVDKSNRKVKFYDTETAFYKDETPIREQAHYDSWCEDPWG